MKSTPREIRNHRTAVITVSYGSGEVLEKFLSSLRRHDGNVAIAVVDNKPDEDAVKDLSERFGAQYLPLPSNPGYGAGMNAGARLLAEMYGVFDAFFFCNPDVEFVEPTIEALSRKLFASETNGSVGPRLLNDDGTVYPSARAIPSIGTGVGHALFSKLWPENPWTRAYQRSADYQKSRSAGSLSGAAVMVKESVYREIGGWDEAYFMHFEDIDLGWRIGNAGYENIYEPSVALQHSGAHSTKKHAAMVERAMTNSAVRFIGKRYAGFWRTPLRWGIMLGLKIRGWLKVRAAKQG